MLWDVGSWSRLATFSSSAIVKALAFMPGGKTLLVGTGDGSLRVLDLSPESRSKPEMEALVQCRSPYQIASGGGEKPHDVLVEVKPDPAACSSAAIRRPPVARSVLATLLLQRAARALESGDLGVGEQLYREAQEIFHALGHPMGEADAALGLAVVAEEAGAADKDRRFHDALGMFDATTPSAVARAERLLELGDFLFNQAHLLAAAARVLDAMNERLPVDETTTYWRDDPELLRLAALLGAGRFLDGLSFAGHPRRSNSQVGKPLAFATLAWIAAIQTNNPGATLTWARKMEQEYTKPAWEARFPRGMRYALSHQRRRLIQADLIMQVLGLAARPSTEKSVEQMRRLLSRAM
jgi:hypothetical protein